MYPFSPIICLSIEIMGLQSQEDNDDGNTTYDYDLIVIGGGSGGSQFGVWFSFLGLAASKEAADLGATVALFDFVKPSPHGSTWGLGGTCVNVGCIPKKLMHQAAIVGEFVQDATSFGWDVPEVHHHWNTLVNNVQDYIRGLNYNYRVSLMSKHVTYYNQLAYVKDSHTVEGTDIFGDKHIYTCRRMIVAVGGRPNKLGCTGEELAVSSDDLFMLDHPPKKTLLVGASFIALECAGFLHHLGFDVTVMVRSILLRGFDQECANKIGDFMKDQGVHFLYGMVPAELKKLPNGRILVKYQGSGFANSDVTGEEEFDTVVSCVGRYADTEKLGLGNLGMKCRRGKILTVNEQTSIPNIYAIGDVIYGKQELTPVAIQAGKLLARRLYGDSKEQMNYENVPMTVFTPLEYGNCGLTEEAAIEKYTDDNIEVYVSQFTPLEWQLSPHRKKDVCFAKLITRRDDGLILGFHVLSPNAGEITQGFGLAFQTGATYKNFMDLVGIHPTIAEEFTTLSVTKRSGASAKKGGC